MNNHLPSRGRKGYDVVPKKIILITNLVKKKKYSDQVDDQKKYSDCRYPLYLIMLKFKKTNSLIDSVEKQIHLFVLC